MNASVFDDIARTDARPRRPGERGFDFFNRSASMYFGHVRALIEEWFAHVPVEHQAELRGHLRADDHQFGAAFWELYLHEAYRRSGFDIEIHPDVAGGSKRPDFLLSLDGEQFYLEAVRVGRKPADVAKERRLNEVYRVLEEMRVEDFALELATSTVGTNPLATRGLRDALRTWLARLDPDQVADGARALPNAQLRRAAGTRLGGRGMEPRVPRCATG